MGMEWHHNYRDAQKRNGIRLEFTSDLIRNGFDVDPKYYSCCDERGFVKCVVIMCRRTKEGMKEKLGSIFERITI